MTKLYAEWKKCSDVFTKPKLKMFFGKWIHDPCLPVWRRPNTIYLCTNQNYVDVVNSARWVKIGETYEKVSHKLPGKLQTYDYVWKSEIRRKLRKYHLSWIKPVIKLPKWCCFYFFNNDIMWKTKYSDIRYEFPPQWTIVFFGFSLSFWTISPTNNTGDTDMYYESMLNYNYKDKDEQLEDFIQKRGYWYRYNKKKDAALTVQKSFLKKEHHPIWEKVFASFKEKYPEMNWVEKL